MRDDEVDVIAECTKCNQKLTRSTLNEIRENMIHENLFRNKNESMRIEKILSLQVSEHKRHCNGKLLVMEELISEQI
jgi:hypothetical protein